MKNIKLNAIILARKDIGEADRLVFGFSQELGRFTFKAKGCRKIKSKLACQIEPYSFGTYYFAEGKAGYILTGAEAVKTIEAITSSIELYKDVSYVCELLQSGTGEEEPHPKLYRIAVCVIESLCSSPTKKREIILRFFEYQLLSETGYRPNFNVCKKCGAKILEEAFYSGDYEGIFCSGCQTANLTISKEIVKVLKMFGKGSLSDILNIKEIEKYNLSLKELITGYLYQLLPKVPRSQDL